MTVLELFAGAGGAARGLHAAGFEHLECVEWDKDAAATLAAAGFPAVRSDVREFRLSLDGHRPGLLWSSFPCQGWSMAGKRRGALDERNGWPWTVEAIDRFRPEWFAGENVPGLVTHSKKGHGDPATCPGCYFESVILPDLRARFAHVQWWILDAADYGVPQRRRRVILVAGPRPVRRPEETHSGWWLACEKWITGRYWLEHGIEAVGGPSREEARLLRDCGRLPLPGQVRWRTMRDALPGLAFVGGGRNPSSRPGDERTERDLTDEPSTTIAGSAIGAAPEVVVRDGLNDYDRSVDDPAPCVRGDDTRAEIVLCPDLPSPTLRAQGATDASGHRGGCAAPLVYVRSEHDTATARSIDEPSPTQGHAGTLYAHAGDPGARKGPMSYTGHTGSVPDEPAKTIKAGVHGPGGGENMVVYAIGQGRAASEPGRLDAPAPTVVASEDKGTRARPSSGFDFHGGPDRASDAAFLATGRRRLTPEECAALQGFPPDHPFQGTKTAKYRQIGNAVPPALARAVGRAIREASEDAT